MEEKNADLTAQTSDSPEAALPKKLLVIIIAMAVVIIGLAAALIAVAAGKGTPSGGSQVPYVSSDSSDDSRDESSDPAAKDGQESSSAAPAEITESGFVLSYSVDNSWGDAGSMNYGVQIGITNNTDNIISGWELKLSIDGLIGCDGWNGTYSASGNTLTISNAEYNGDIPAGGSISVGCNAFGACACAGADRRNTRIAVCGAARSQSCT